MADSDATIARESQPFQEVSEDNVPDSLILKPAGLLIQLITNQADFITNSILSLTSPFLSIASESFHRSEEARDNAEETVHAVPSRVAEGSALFLRKVGFGLVGAAYVCLILVAVLIFALMVGVGLVWLWVEEPVFVRELLHFDYTDVHPTAVFSLQGKECVVPSGHTFSVSVVLLLPESDFNRHIGIFQVTAEVISTTGNILAISSQPCMLHFRSLPVRLMRTFVMSIPLLLGISDETQIITIPLLKHKEGNPHTEAIRARLVPRAGTSALPQLYSAEIIMNSQLPWRKQLVYNWKWTFYVWTSLYVYMMCLIVLLSCCRPFLFPSTTMALGMHSRSSVEEARETKMDREAYESLRNWQPSRRGRSRSKRRALFPHENFPETAGSSVSSLVTTRDEASEVIEDWGGFTDGESVCQGG